MTASDDIYSWRVFTRGYKTAELPSGADILWDRAKGFLKSQRLRTGKFLKQADAVLSLHNEISKLSDASLKQAADELRKNFRLGRDTQADRIKALAVVREIARRVRGEHPFRVQVAGAMAMLDGCVTEMATGEGKTLVASLVATLEGWRGKGCHVLTVNDYLAQRDAEAMRGIFEFCGLTCGYVVQEMSPPERKRSYDCDVTYLTNKEVTADFLRDQLKLGRRRRLLDRIVDSMNGRRNTELLQRGLYRAIVDEADSILVDEAVTPLIISGEPSNQVQVEAFCRACEIAAPMMSGRDYSVNHQYQEIRLTDGGRAKLHEIAGSLGGVWAGARRSEELLVQALTAKEFYENGRQYIVDDGKVVIVDEATGRLMPDREWRDGLHQAVTAKEKLEVHPPKDTFARISFQRFFRLYEKLCGMTGTAREARWEFWDIYNLPTVRIPTNRQCIRKKMPLEVFGDRNAKNDAIVDEVRRIHAQGRPVLIGTRSVKESVALSEKLSDAGLEHQVLNAVYHKIEAQIISAAGNAGQITVATNMAGRGTDIKLGRGVDKLGGLHVIATEKHFSRRVDRQLQGRSARQGDPGSAVEIISLDDELFVRYAGLLRFFIKPFVGKNSTGSIIRVITKLAAWAGQFRAGRQALAMRKNVVKTDSWLDETLGFAGKEL